MSQSASQTRGMDASRNGNGAIERETNAVLETIQNNNQTVRWILVLDFEATCDTKEQMRRNEMEIIEFPTVVYDTTTRKVVTSFQQYVQATQHSVSQFCTEVTGITQEMSDAGLSFRDALVAYDAFIQPYVSSGSFLFVTCGDWDLKTMLPVQCKREGVEVPAYFNSWMNIKRPFEQLAGTPGKGMAGMLSNLRIPLTGRHHSGIDDCRNICKIVHTLVEADIVLAPTGEYVYGKLKIYKDRFTAEKRTIKQMHAYRRISKGRGRGRGRGRRGRDQ